MLRTLLLIPILLAALVGAHGVAGRADADSTIYDASTLASIRIGESLKNDASLGSHR
jgi:hypothetical protein